MNNPDTEIKRWRIVVIQSLQKEDKKTGEELYNDILKYKKLQRKEANCEFYNVSTKKDFSDTMKKIDSSIADGDIVTLQVETHGCDDGIVLNSSEIITWKEFYNLCRPINIKTGHLLFVVMAMCKSLAMISSINPEDRAPYRTMLCTTRIVSNDEISRAFQAFYDLYFNLLDFSKAYDALKKEMQGNQCPFVIMSAEYVYDETFKPHDQFDNVVIAQLERERLPHTQENFEITRKKLVSFLIERHDKFYSYYNFKDYYQK